MFLIICILHSKNANFLRCAKFALRVKLFDILIVFEYLAKIGTVF